MVCVFTLPLVLFCVWWLILHWPFPATGLNNTENQTAFPWRTVPQKGFKTSAKWKACYGPSISQFGCAVKHAIRQLKHLAFTALCVAVPLAFHKAVSVYHTWLGNNPVVGQTTNPEDMAPKSQCKSGFYTSLFLSLSFKLPLCPLLLINHGSHYLILVLPLHHLVPVSSPPLPEAGLTLPSSLFKEKGGRHM